MVSLSSNLAEVRQRMAVACRRVARAPDDVRLVAVTKSVSLDVIQQLADLGCSAFGENRPQQLIERAAQVPGEWHLIGQLQRNKVRAVLPHVLLIHSIDSERLLERISQISAELGMRPSVLLQVNVSGESSKQGFTPAELRAAWDRLTRVPHLDVRGLMTMAPLTEDQAQVRAVFRGLRILRDDLQLASPATRLTELSMGMSGDFEIAIEEGATLVRIGSAILEHASN